MLYNTSYSHFPKHSPNKERVENIKLKKQRSQQHKHNIREEEEATLYQRNLVLLMPSGWHFFSPLIRGSLP